MKILVVIIPAYNEEEGIGQVLDRMPKQVDGIDRLKVVVINDGSTDHTAAVAREKGAEVISHPSNQGLGVAFRNGIERALEKGADIIVNIDADGQFDPEDIPQLVAPILKDEAEVVTASRFLSPELKPKMSRIKAAGNKFMSAFISKIVKEKYYDVSCGFRAYSKDAALKMNLFGKFTYTQESFIDLAAKNVPIKEVPIRVKGERLFGKSKIASNLFKYGFNTTRIILSAFRDYKPLRLMTFIGMGFLAVGIPVGVFFALHYFRTGSFRPHTWAAVLSFACFVLALFMIVVGVILEMFSRMRIIQEQLIYLAKRERYEARKAEDAP